MKNSLFEYQDYKGYLIDVIDQMPGNGRGERSKIAALLRCHIAYVSQVLNGDAHFSLEQADVLNAHFRHSPEESDFFLLLVQISRAGTQSLKNHYKTKVKKILSQRTELKNRLQYEKELSAQVQPIYYSAWYYTAIHFCLKVPELQTKDAISAHLSLPQPLVEQVLDFLMVAGLAVKKGVRYEMGVTRLHLPSDSPMISKHHTNWRLQALQSLERNDPEELHYSSVAVIRESDLPKYREALVKAIEEVRRISKPEAPDEALYCYSIDLFRVGSKRELFVEKIRNEKRKKHETVSNSIH